MKLIILALSFFASSFTAFSKEITVSKKVLDAFKTEFASAKETVWTIGDNYYQAAFNYNEKQVYAYYSTDGELFGLTRYISSFDLPLNLQISLKKKTGNSYWISDLFEVSKSTGTNYYVTLENADNKIVLKSTDMGTWEIAKSIKKV